MVSVIVPVYNAEKHLERCLKSLENQTNIDYEVLLIDDGSMDSSSVICKMFVENNKKFRYVYQNNSGVSSARNTGLKYAKGEYITFVDADDWVEPTYINKLLLSCKKNKCEITLCSRVVENGIQSKEIFFDDVIDEKCEKTEEFIPSSNHLYGAVWGGIYAYSVVKNVSFDENIYFGEDMVFISTIIKKSKNICRINDTLYHYWKNPNESSLSKGDFSEKRISNLKAYRKTATIFEYNRNAKEVILGRYCDACSYFINTYYSDPRFKKEFYKNVLKEYRNNYKYMIKTFRKSWIWELHDFFLLVCPKVLLNMKMKLNSYKSNI